MKWRSVLPPRRKDWTPGATQVGLFIRTSDGGTAELSVNMASPEATKAAYALFVAMTVPAKEIP